MGIPDCFQGISLIHLVFIRLCCICSHEHLPRLHFLYYNTFTLHIYYSICREICNIHSPAFRLQDRIGIYRLFFLDSNLIHIHYKAERVFLQEKSFSTSPFVYSIDNSMNWFFCRISTSQGKCKFLILFAFTLRISPNIIRCHELCP